MIRNFFLVAIRNLVKSKVFSAVTILGLSVALVAFLIILQYFRFETSFDSFHRYQDRLYRVEHTFLKDGEIDFQSAKTYPSVGPRLQDEFPEVDLVCRLFKKYRPGTLLVEDKSFKEENIFYADSTFFDVFTFPLLKGNAATALRNTGTLIMEERLASKLFGTLEVIGKRLRIGSMDGTEDFEITGVFKSPENSHLHVSVVCSYASLISLYGQDANTSWGWYDFYTYLTVKPDVRIENLEAKLPDFVTKHNGGSGSPRDMALSLRKVSNIHLDSNMMMEASSNGNRETVYTIMVIGVIILVIAWINYLILATARAMERAKEVGLRKVVGSSRLHLSVQFMAESLFTGVLATIISIVLLIFLIPYLQQGGAQWISMGIFIDYTFWMYVAALVVVGSFLVGMYPAFVMSSFKPMMVLKGSFRNSAFGVFLRKILICTQFAASIVLMVAVLVVNKQLDFMNSTDPGFRVENMMVVQAPDVINNADQYYQSLETFRQSITQLPKITSASVTSDVPGSPVGWYNGARRLGTDATYAPITLYTMTIDQEFIKTYGLKMRSGRFYSDLAPTDSMAVIVNETAARLLGFTSAEEALENVIRFRRDTFRIAGVLADYYHESPKMILKPTIYLHIPEEKLYFTIHFEGTSLAEAAAIIKPEFDKLFPAAAFTYFSLHDHYLNQHQSERSAFKLLQGFGLVAILLSTIGLFALTSYSVLQRVKEISVRKVLGAADGQIFSLFTWENLKLIIISNIIAFPLSYWIMNKWLEQYAIRTTIGFEIFITTIFLSTGVTLLAIVYNAWRASRMNPIKALRSE